jgi:hypothetical protein
MINNALREKAIELAAHLPKNREDAEIVVGLLSDLIEWIYPAVRRDGLDFNSNAISSSNLDLSANGKPDGSPR